MTKNLRNFSISKTGIPPELVFRNYTLVYFLFALGGVTAFSSNSRFLQVFAVFIVILFFYKKKDINIEIVFIVLFVSLLFIGQYFKFHIFSLKNYLVLMYTFVIPYAIIKVVGRNFTKYYINTAFLFAIISFFFVIPSYLFPEFRSFTENLAIQLNLDPVEGVHENFIIYNYEKMVDGLIKNPGPFYEAGAFGAFLILALILNLVRTKKVFEKKNFVFIIAILSTFSTSSYLALFSVLFFYFTSTKKLWKNLLLLPLILFLAYQSFSEFSFLQQKIKTQLEQSSRLGEQDLRVGRFHSARLDLIDIVKYPVIGRGLIAETRFENKKDIGSNNGLTDLAVRYGVFGFIFYFFLTFQSLKAYCNANTFNRRFAFFSIIPIALVLFSQVIYAKPAFLALMMMFMLYKEVKPELLRNVYK